MAGDDDEMMDISSEGSIMGPSDIDDGENEETLLPKDVIQRIEQGWMNEKMAPELLPPLTLEKDAAFSVLKIMERNLSKLEDSDIRTGLHRLEFERVRYVVISYMRVRLLKIQNLAWGLYDAEMKRENGSSSMLFPEELKFLKEYITVTEEYFKSSVAPNFPMPLRKIEPKKFIQPPRLNTFVFFRPTEDNEILVEDALERTHTISLKEGEQHFMRYQPIAHLVQTGAANLV